MAQEPSSRELLEAVKQQESGGRRYKADGKTLLEGPQTKYGTAKGEMQVLDMTNKDPGYGVKPAKDDSPDERARVGRDYLNAMVNKYGDKKTALVAYNWGPGNTDKWLKAGADPAKLPKETQKYVANITASLGGTKVSPTKVAAGPKADVPLRRTGTGLSQAQLFSQLGPSYQAAMAVSMLADEGEKEGKDEDAPSESEKMLAAMPSAPAPAVDLDLGYQSPFPEIPAQAAPVTRKQVSFLRPVRMAAGGLPFDPTASVRPSARAELDAIKAEYDTFAPALEEYNKAVEKYNVDVYKPYQTQVDAYNADLEKYKAEQLAPYQTQLDAYNAALNKYTTENSTPYQAQIDAYNAALNKYKTDIYDPYQAQIDAYNTALGKYKTDVYDPYEAAQKKYDAEYASVFATPKPVSFVMSNQYRDLMARKPVTPAEFSMTAPVAPKEFTMAVPTAPAGFTMAVPTAPAQFSRAAPTKPVEFAQKAPTGPAVSQEAYNAKMAAAKADASRRQVALSVAMDPQAYGLSMPKLFAEGGQVYRAKGSPETGEYFQDPFGVPDSGPVTSDTLSKGKDFKAAEALQALKEVGAGAARNLKNILKGTTETPYNFFGGAADIGNLALTPFGLGSKEPMLGSAQLKRLATEAGIRPSPPTDPRDAGFYMMGELGSSVVNPGPIAAKGGKAAEMLAKAAAKGTAKEMLRGIEGQGVLAPISPQDSIMYAVKPRGGTSLTSGSLDKPAISKIDKTIEAWFDRTAQDAPDAETTKIIRDFLDKKGRKYLTNELGTGADPIRKAMASGEIQPVGGDVEIFPEYLLHSARTLDAPGHSAAKKDLEKLYDRASTVEGRVVGMHDPADADARNRFSALLRQSKTDTRNAMTQEGVPQELQTLSIQGVSGDQLGESYNANLMKAVNAPTEFPAIAGAVQRGQPIYDLGYQGMYMEMFSPKYVAENINAIIPAKRLNNMSFDDAMIEGSKLMEVSRNYDKAVEMVAKGANVPKEVLFQYTRPVIAADNGQWVQLTDKLATKMEGKMLHHSVGGYATSDTYGHGGKKGFDTGVANVFSLRDPKTGLAKTTLEAKKLEDGSLMFSQHKGNFNSFPEKDVKDIFTLFDKLGKDKPVSLSRYEERYPNDPTGTPLPRAIEFYWGKAYQQWKDTGKLPPIPSAFGDTLPPPPSQIDTPFAKGGMVERQVSTARYI